VRPADWLTGFFLCGSAKSRLAAPGAIAGKVDGLRCIALLRAAWCVVRDAYAGRVDGLWCIELLPSQLGLLP
jgi:hypothetical protein